MIWRMKRVTLEPELELIAAGLNFEERRRLARKFFRWSKQLFVSAAIMAPEPKAPRQLKPLAMRKLSQN